MDSKVIDNNTDDEIIEKININDILLSSLKKNKVLILAILPLFGAYFFQDVIFSKTIAKVSSNVTEFVQDIDVKKIALVLLPYILAVILFYLSDFVTSKTMTRIELDSIHTLVEKIILSIKTSKQEINIEDINSHIKKLVDTKNIYKIVVMYILPTFVISFGLLYNFYLGSPKYSLVVCLIIIVMMIITTKLELDSIKQAHEAELYNGELFDEIDNVLANIDTVITSNTQKYELNNIDKKRQNAYKMINMGKLNNTNTTYSLYMINISFILGINYLSYRLYIEGKIQPSIFTAIILMSILLMDYFNMCISSISSIIVTMGKYTETIEYFDKFKIITPTKALKEMKLKEGNIQIKNISVKYGNNLVLHEKTENIYGNSITGFFGPIGSGKSTLLKVLAGITDYDGDILYDGENINNYTLESINNHIDYISQYPKLFDNTIYYNINYGSSYTQKELSEILDNYGLSEFINSFADGLDTQVGKMGKKVSGGQKQFISFIRSIVQNKKILLLDEPTASLDEKNKSLFINLVRQLSNKTIIISTHDTKLNNIFDRIIKF